MDHITEALKYAGTVLLTMLLTILGLQGRMVSKKACAAKQASCVRAFEKDLKSMCNDIKEIKELQKKVFDDFYKPRLTGKGD